MLRLSASLSLTVLLACTGAASADTLLIERVQQQRMAMPTRGMTMAQVEARFGTPADRMDPRGGQKRQWPTINRWAYPGFVVYFEKNRVIESVAIQATATEIGPKPPIR